MNATRAEEFPKASTIRGGEFLADEFDGIGFVATGVDDFETDFGADEATDKLSAGVGSFANRGLVVDFLDEKTVGEAGVVGGSLREDFGDLQQLSVFIDTKGIADTGEFEDHSSATLFCER